LNQGDAVSLDALARTLRETERKLRAQHQGRSVDFQIVVKDGKAVVKPVVRK
jgi:glutamate mutase epsilon subunit